MQSLKFLCSSDHVPQNQSRGLEFDGLKLLAVRRDGQVFVYQNRCPHRGVALEWQADQFLDPSASLIQCATHGALFLIESGECVAGPCEGQSLRAIACHEDQDGIWIAANENA
jgi:nitrite reductase/ring-hydroxylating ferredoxin subunit